MMTKLVLVLLLSATIGDCIYVQRDDPSVDGENDCCSERDNIRAFHVGYIRKYWTQYKKISVIFSVS